jgi:hypothetical protein
MASTLEAARDEWPILVTIFFGSIFTHDLGSICNGRLKGFTNYTSIRDYGPSLIEKVVLSVSIRIGVIRIQL